MDKSYLTISIASIGLSLLTGWAIWCKLLNWLCTFLPDPSVSWHGIAKLGILVLVGYSGGIVIPVVLLLVAIAALIKAVED